MKDAEIYQLPNGKYDIKLTDGKSTWVEDGRQAVQHAIIRLNKFKGESATGNQNEDETDIYGIIFNVKKTKAEKILHIKSRILGTPDIEKFISFNYEQTRRNVRIDCVVKTVYGTHESLVATIEAV
jgi:hypothetical protein